MLKILIDTFKSALVVTMLALIPLIGGVASADAQSITGLVFQNAQVLEGGSIDLEVTLDRSAPAGGFNVEVTLDTSGSDAATPGADISSSFSFTIPAGQTTETFPIPTVDDDEAEVREYFALAAVTGEDRVVSNPISIVDNEPYSLTVTTDDITLEEGTQVSFMASLDRAYHAIGGTPLVVVFAPSGDVHDFVISSTVTSTTALVFREGRQQEIPVTVMAIEDALDEDTEVLTLNFEKVESNIVDVEIANQVLTFTIAEHSTPNVELSGAPETVSSTTESFDVTATFNEDVTGFVTGDPVLENAEATVVAVSGSVYTLSVTPTGEGDVSITIPAGVADYGEDATNPVSNTVTVFFVNEGTPEIIGLNFVNTQVAEGDTISLEVTLSEAPQEDLNFELTLDTPDTPVTDAASGADISSSLSFTIPAGQTTETFSIPTVDDEVAEVREYFALAAGERVSNRISIVDNEPYSLTVSPTESTLKEGEEVSVTASLDRAYHAITRQSLFVIFPNQVLLDAGEDFVITVEGQDHHKFLKFREGEPLEQDITVMAIEDALDEDTETATITLMANSSNPADVEIANPVLTFTIEEHTTAPNVEISDAPAAVSSTEPFVVTASFDQAVTGFVASGLVLEHATAEISGTGAVYTLTVTPTGAGDVSITIPADVAQGVDSNGGNTASNTLIVGFVIAEISQITGLNFVSTQVLEGGSISLTVTLGAPSAEDFDFDLTLDMSGSSASESDISSSLSFTFPAGERDARFSIQIAEDSDPEEREYFSLTAGEVESNRISIVDDEPYIFTVTPTGPSTLEEGGDAVVVTASLDRAYHAIGGAIGSKSLFVTLPNQVLLDAGEDFVITVEGQDHLRFLSFTEGEALEQKIIVMAKDDELEENTETATITFTQNPSTPVDIATSELTFTIENHATPTVELSAPATVSSTEPFVVTATFDEDVTGFDFTDLELENAVNPTVEGTGAVYTLSVTPTGDGDVEITIPAGAAQDGDNNDNTASNTVTVFFVTAGTPEIIRLNFENAQVAEGESIDLEVTLSEAPQEDLNFELTLDTSGPGDAASGADISSLSITIPEGDTTATVSIQIVDDSAAEVREFFSLSAGERVSNRISIVDNEPYSFTVTPIGPSHTLVEGRRIVVRAFLDRAYHAIGGAIGSQSLDVNVAYETSSDADSDADFTIAGDPLAGDAGDTITFTEGGVLINQITVLTIEDGLDEGDETLTMTFTQDPSTPVEIANPVLTITIEAHDSVVSAPTVELSAHDPVIGTEPFVVTATFSEDVTGFEASDLTLENATATVASVEGTGSVYALRVIPSGDGDVSITIPEDAAVGGDNDGNTASNTVIVVFERIQITGLNFQGAEQVAEGDTFDLTVTLNDEAPAEGFDVVLTLDTSGPGEAAAESDITTLSFTFPEGERDARFDIQTVDDSDPEVREYIRLSAEDGGVLSNTISIVDNEPYFFTASTPNDETTILEGEQVVVTASLDRAYHAIGGAIGDQFLDVSVGVADAVVFGDDFLITVENDNGQQQEFRNTVRFIEGGKDGLQIIVQAKEDQLDEDAETAEITFTQDPSTPVEIANSVLTFTIEAHDTLNVMLEGAPDAVSDIEPFVVTATFDEDVTGFVATDLTLENATATVEGSGAVYTLTVTPIELGEVSITIPAGVAQAADGTANPGESNTKSNTVNVGYFVAQQGMTAVPPPQIMELEFLADAVAEGDSIDLEVMLSEAPEEDFNFELTLETSGPGAAASSDDISSSLSFTFPAEETSATFSIQIADDSEAEGMEVLSLAAGEIESNPVSIMNVEHEDDPTVTFLAPTAVSGTEPFEVTVTFSEAVMGFEASDIELENATVTDFSGSGSDYMLTVTPSGDGDVSITIPQGAAEDVDGNDNAALGPFIVRFDDTTVPTVTLSGAPTTVNNIEPFDVTATFSEDVTGFEASELTLVNARATVLAVSGAVYTLTVTPTGRGEVSITIPADVAEDAAGNNNTASSTVTVGNTIVEDTKREIAGFMLDRANKLASNQPGLTRFLQGTGCGAFSANITAGSGSVEGCATRGNAWAEITSARSAGSSYTLGTLGVHGIVQPNLIVGGLVQFDAADDDTRNISGTGWLVGPYFVKKFSEQNVFIEGRLLYGQSDNDITRLATYTDRFKTERRLIQFRTTGEYEYRTATLMPLLDFTWTDDTQETYTDSLDNLITEQRVDLTQLTAGMDFSLPVQVAQNGSLDITGGLSGIYSSTSGGVSDFEGWRGRTEFGLDYSSNNSTTLRAATFYDGILSDHESYGITLSLDAKF